MADNTSYSSEGLTTDLDDSLIDATCCLRASFEACSCLSPSTTLLSRLETAIRPRACSIQPRSFAHDNMRNSSQASEDTLVPSVKGLSCTFVSTSDPSWITRGLLTLTSPR